MIQSVKKLMLVLALAGLTSWDLRAASVPADYGMYDPLVDVTDLIQRHYVTETGNEQLISGAINGMLHALDPYSEYIPASELEDFNKLTSGSYEGIGIGIDVQEGHVTVISPFEGSPAFKAGVLPGDVILSVEGMSTKGWSVTRVMRELTGPAGSSVTLELVHPEGQRAQMTLTRTRIHVPTVRGWRRGAGEMVWDYLLDPGQGIGYVRISQFTPETCGEFDQAMAQLNRRQMRALILDLRENPGGLLQSAVQVADRFIDQGVIVSTRGAHTQEQVTRAVAEGTYPRFPLVVLIDQGSASAAEIVAGALQDHDRARIVGMRSWGKGSVQRPFMLPETGAVLKLTTDYYYLPKGRCVHRLPGAQEWGVTPDSSVSNDPNQAQEYRNLLKELMMPSAPPVRQNSGQEKPSGAAPAEDRLAQVRVILLHADRQLAEAVHQCRTLLEQKPPSERIGSQEQPAPTVPITPPVEPAPAATEPGDQPL